MTEPRPMSGELEHHLIDRAMRDSEFLALLRSDPKAALEAEILRLGLAIRIPDGLKVEVLEETADTLYLVLPPGVARSTPRQDEFFLEVLNSLNVGGEANQTS